MIMAKIEKNIKIAVVDDSDFSRRTMIEILENEGYNVLGEAPNAEIAIQIAQTTPIDLFIVDVVMPGTSGIELVNHLKEISSNFKIIMISSLKIDNIIIESISAGALDFLQKPFEKEELLNSITRVSQLSME